MARQQAVPVKMIDERQSRELRQSGIMGTYDYYARVSGDLRDNLGEWFDAHDINGYDGFDKLAADITDHFFAHAGVTGKASEPYTTDAWEAEENICHNMGLLLEASMAFRVDYGEYVDKGVVYCDVAIRCYVLCQVARDVIREYVSENYPGFRA